MRKNIEASSVCLTLVFKSTNKSPGHGQAEVSHMMGDRLPRETNEVGEEQKDETRFAWLRILTKLMRFKSREELQAFITNPDALLSLLNRTKFPLVKDKLTCYIDYDISVEKIPGNILRLNDSLKDLNRCAPITRGGKQKAEIAVMQLFQSGPLEQIREQMKLIGYSPGTITDIVYAVRNLTIGTFQKTMVCSPFAVFGDGSVGFLCAGGSIGQALTLFSSLDDGIFDVKDKLFVGVKFLD